MSHRGWRAGAVALALLVVAGTSNSARAASVTEVSTLTPDGAPIGLATGPSSSVWYASHAGSKIGKISSSGTVTEYAVANNSAGSTGILEGMAAGPSSTLWFTDSSSVVPRIGKVNTSTGASTLYPVTDSSFAGERITDITAGPDGNMWFTGNQNGHLGRITPAGAITVYDTSADGLVPYAITAGPEGGVWFTDTVGGAVGRIDPATGAVTAFYPDSSFNGSPAMGGIAAGPDGNLWFTEPGVGKVGKVTPAGVITEYSVPTANSAPEGIVKGSDGNLWFTEAAAGNIAKITTSGTVTEYPLPSTFSTPMRIIAGPSSQLWFTEAGKAVLGHFSPSSPPSGSPHAAVAPQASGAIPRLAGAFQARCPQAALICQTQVNTGGTVAVGGFSQTMPAGAIRVTGYISSFGSDGTATLKAPLTGSQFESTAVEVPGGIIGTIPGIGPILGLTPITLLPFNKLTTTETLVGPITVANGAGGIAATATVNIHLNNTLLGSNCVIGPITEKLAPTPRSGGALTDLSLNWQPQTVELKDNTFTVPAASGCGIGGILDGIINSTMGLPSAAGSNSLDLPAVLSIGPGLG
jgi:streptogramin lyase